ncbi:26S proteasome regulatory subunit 7-like [Apium graveolens]|uniref:26S proteasome regulatory subunit 7-like n=1 Tax=Apium graveolens TaxID=4045 RepID=UPI003D7BFFCC
MGACRCGRGCEAREHLGIAPKYVNAHTINGKLGPLFPCYEKLVEIDAVYTKPFTTSAILIAPGQTTNVLVHANQMSGRYYMAGKSDVTYNDVGGCNEQIEKIRKVVELPMLHPEMFVKLGIDPPRGVLCYGPPGTGKTLLARAVANRTDACFIHVIGSELVQKYVGEGARIIRELLQMARSKKACIVFFDEIDAIGGARFDDGVGGDNKVQRTMLEIINQLDGFDARGNIKVLMMTNRPDALDPALLRPGRLDREVEFGLPDLESRTQMFKIHTRTMNCERDIRFEFLARLCPNSTGADIRSVCTKAGMYAIRARRKTVTEMNFLDAVNKVIKGYHKFSATPKYMVYS